MLSIAVNAGIVFVGANDIVTEDTYLWVDGTPFTGPWGPGQPNNLNEQDCIIMETAYGYNFSDIACSSPYKFLCQTPPTATPTVPPSITTSLYQCQQGYTHYPTNNICWRLEASMPSTWQAARTACNNDGGDLLVINTENFLSYIKAEMTTGRKELAKRCKSEWVHLVFFLFFFFLCMCECFTNKKEQPFGTQSSINIELSQRHDVESRLI